MNGEFIAKGDKNGKREDRREAAGCFGARAWNLLLVPLRAVE
jgi:hypothetical protein